MTATRKKKLIEVALPLVAINKASVREGYIYRGNPSALHKWWAQRPLAASRAVIFAQMVDDPSSYPDRFPTDDEQEAERERLFRIIERIVEWENTGNRTIIDRARNEIRECWKRACSENQGHPRAAELYDPESLPPFHDPFAGSGAIPLEAQRLGLTSRASDLNPVAVLINKATIEIPQKFAGRPPVNPARDPHIHWNGAEGLADDIRSYGQWIRDRAERLIGHLYPKAVITAEMAAGRPELEQHVGEQFNVISWIWARTVRSPNPAFAGVDVPIVSTFMLSTKSGKEAYVHPIISDKEYRFVVKNGRHTEMEQAKSGTRLGGAFRCIMSKEPIPLEYIRTEAKAGRMGQRLLAAVVEGPKGRFYISPTYEMESVAYSAEPIDPPDSELPDKALGFRVQAYGMKRWRDLFTSRQLVALSTFSDLIREATSRLRSDAVNAGMIDDDVPLNSGGVGARAYAEAVSIYLAFAQDKTAEYGCTIVPWYTKEDRPKGLFARHAIPMVWDFAEVNPLSDIGGTFSASVGIVAGALLGCAAEGQPATAVQLDAIRTNLAAGAVVSLDPPYYDNIGYADLSDFFYVWLRRTLRQVYPDLFSTVAVPKAEELVATAYRHGSKERAEAFFLEGMTQAMHRLAGRLYT